MRGTGFAFYRKQGHYQYKGPESNTTSTSPSKCHTCMAGRLWAKRSKQLGRKGMDQGQSKEARANQLDQGRFVW